MMIGLGILLYLIAGTATSIYMLWFARKHLEELDESLREDGENEARAALHSEHGNTLLGVSSMIAGAVWPWFWAKHVYDYFVKG